MLEEITKINNPYPILIITIIASCIFGYRASRDKAGVVEVLLYALVSAGGSILVIIATVYYCPFKNDRVQMFWGAIGFALTFLIDGIVLLLIFLDYSRKNPTKYLHNKEIVFEKSYIFGGILNYIFYGLVLLGLAGMYYLVECTNIRGLIALIDLIPLVLGSILAIKSRNWLLNLMTYVVRKNLPEEVTEKLVESNEDQRSKK